MKMYITEAQAQRLLEIRKLGGSNRKHAKKTVMRQIKDEHGIAQRQFILIAIENPENPLYRCIRAKGTGLPLDNGVAEPAPVPAIGVSPVAEAPGNGKQASEAPDAPLKVAKKKPSAAPVPKKQPALAAPAKKVPAKKVAAKAAPKADKAAAKKVATAAVAKAAGKPVKAVAVKKAPLPKTTAKAVVKPAAKTKAGSKA